MAKIGILKIPRTRSQHLEQPDDAVGSFDIAPLPAKPYFHLKPVRFRSPVAQNYVQKDLPSTTKSGADCYPLVDKSANFAEAEKQKSFAGESVRSMLPSVPVEEEMGRLLGNGEVL